MKVSAKPYADYRKMLASADVDAVLIATPDYVHCENVKEAIAAGKHIFCEKPLAINVQDCDDMLRAHATRPDLVFGVGLCLRFTPICQTMHEMIADGEIGRPQDRLRGRLGRPRRAVLLPRLARA